MIVYTNLSLKTRFFVSILIGIIIGIIGGITRFGWEFLLPIHLNTEMGEIAKHIMEFFSITNKTLEMSIDFNGIHWNLIYVVWQFVFSLFFGIIYAILVEFCFKLKFAHGIFYGLAIWFVLYMIVYPLCGFTISYNANDFWIYLISSFLESLLWIWIMELIRRDLRNRITQERDPF